MLSLKNETDVIREARTLVRAYRMALSWRQADLAKRSGVGVATIRRFESTGRIGFVGLAKLITSLGLVDHFLGALKQPPVSPKDINEFITGGPSPVRQRAPRRTGGN
jgi:transcriptional regulator with XRE-family HTH domain